MDIKGFVLKAIGTKQADGHGVKDLLGPTTIFRSSKLYPREKHLLQYEFRHWLRRHRGFLGFDENYNLVSIDRRTPGDQVEEWLDENGVWQRRVERIHVGRGGLSRWTELVSSTVPGDS